MASPGQLLGAFARRITQVAFEPGKGSQNAKDGQGTDHSMADAFPQHGGQAPETDGALGGSKPVRLLGLSGLEELVEQQGGQQLAQ